MKKLLLTLPLLAIIGAGCNNTTTPDTKPAEHTQEQTETTDTSLPEDELAMIQKLYAAVPEISAKSQENRDASNGDVNVSVKIEKEAKEGDLYPVQVFEDHDTHTVPIWTFYMDANGDKIMHQNELTLEMESLDTWRRTKDELPE